MRPWEALDNVVSRVEALRAACLPSLVPGGENGINIDNYRPKNCIVGYDLMPAEDIPPLSAFSPPLTDPVILKISLDIAVGTAVTIIVYSEYEAEMQMDAHGNVKTFEDGL